MHSKAVYAAGGQQRGKRGPKGSITASLAPKVFGLSPRVPASAGATSSALAISKQDYGSTNTEAGSTPYRFKGYMRTVEQLRSPTPNAWEVAWVIWNYQDNDNFYYFTIKSNGWEIGKRDPFYFDPGVNDGQKVIVTGNFANFAVGTWYGFDIHISGSTATLTVNGRQIVDHSDVPYSFTDNTAGNKYYAGKVGLYTEDANVEFDNITAPLLDTFDNERINTYTADGTTALANWTIVFLGGGHARIAEGTS